MHKFCKNVESKKTKARRSYEPEFKAEILKMLICGKKVSEIAETFGIAKKRSAVAAAVSLENFIYNEDKPPNGPVATTALIKRNALKANS